VLQARGFPLCRMASEHKYANVTMSPFTNMLFDSNGMDVPEYFSIELIDAINRWMIAPTPEAADRIDKAAVHLPAEFKSRNEPVFRRIALEKGFVWDLLAEARLLEKISSWSLSEDVAKKFDGGVPPLGWQGVIFKIDPTKGRTVLNISRLFASGQFRIAIEKYASAVPNSEYGIREFQDSEREVLIEVDALYPDEIFSLAGYSSSREEIIRQAGIEIYRREPNVEEQTFLADCLEKTGHKLGPAWLTEQQVLSVRSRLNGTVPLLRHIKQLQEAQRNATEAKSGPT
jgi:hypothetical protein